MLPVQIDLLYRTGASGSFVSILSFAITAYAFARLVIAATHSHVGATAAVALLALNPNLLYLQSTPMTEPLLLAATSLTTLWLFEWVQGDRERLPARLSVALFAAMWTRYEAWPIVACACAAALFACWRRPITYASLARRALHLVLPPAIAVILFVINSRITVGSWFVTGGFYVPDPAYQHKTGRTLLSIWWGTHQLSSYTVEIVALAGAVVLAVLAFRRREDARLLLPIAPFAAAALPFYAFFEGHPYRIRYMIPMVAACALSAGLATGLARRWAPLLLALLIGSSLLSSPPWSRSAPMLLEAQWDRPASMARRQVSACLSRRYRGGKILASMGSLAHYMQELSWDGFNLAEFIHEGNGDIWNLALETGPAPHAGWMLVEEQAEGGDVLAQRIKSDPRFAAGMRRVCDGGGVALYERTAAR
jgi:hypothetical protein